VNETSIAFMTGFPTPVRSVLAGIRQLVVYSSYAQWNVYFAPGWGSQVIFVVPKLGLILVSFRSPAYSSASAA
jgi:hypothetical protein